MRKAPPRDVSFSESSISTCSSTSSSWEDSPKPAKKNRRRRPRKKKASVAQIPTISEEQKQLYVALDCEMVEVESSYRPRSCVARVTLVNWDGEVLLDEYVQPTGTVVDYRTHVSGIHPQQMNEAQHTIESIRGVVLGMLHGKVLVGHALKNDLKVLGISHPWQQTRDTAKYEPFMQTRFDDGILWPRKLKDLCYEKLNLNIQNPGQAHSPIEDAKAALELYKQVRTKWEKAMTYKIQKTAEIEAKTTT